MNPAVFHRRCLFLCLIFVIGLSGLSARLIYLQVVKAKDYSKKSDRVSVRKEILKANRGCIVDCNNQLIARNIPRASIALDKKLLRDVGLATLSLANKELRSDPEWGRWDYATRKGKLKARAARIKNEIQADVIIEQHIAHVVSTMARPLGMPPHELRSRMKLENERQTYVVIKPDLSMDDAEKLRELTRDYSMPHAFVFEERQKRWYVMPKMASHIVGFNDHEGTGKAGIERQLNHLMAGKDGYVKLHRDHFDHLAVAKPKETRTPRHGLNVQLTLDMGLQAILEEELDAGLAEYVAEKGTIILMDPHTGAILAMASRPTYDLNTRENIAKNGYDFATQVIYEPGSTFKIIATSGTLDQGLVQPGTQLFCHNGIYHVGRIRVPDHHPYGMLSVEGVLAKSSNIGAYKLGLQLGRGKFFDYVEAYGFGKKSGIKMTGESSGVVRDTGNPTDFSRVTYGYSVSVTPLQVACAYSAIANGGKLMKPQLVKSVMANNGAKIMDFKPIVVRQVIKKSTAAKMREALSTVIHGQRIMGSVTGWRAKVAGFLAGGKTGTTRKIHPDGGYYDGKNGRELRYTVSFAGMLPAHKPAFVCVVVVDDPRTTKIKHGGGSIAAPIFQKVATRVANRMGLEPTEPIDPDSSTQPLAQSSQ